MSARARGVLLVALVGLPTVLLGAGWLASTLRERTVREASARADLARTADVVRAAVDESLEELRRREDAREFYFYNYFYSPPDVLAVNDPVAVTPLARDPDDPRVLGYFQIEPDGTVRTPYAPEPTDPLPPRGERVLAAVDGPLFTTLRPAARASPSLVAVVDPPVPVPVSDPDPAPIRNRNRDPSPPNAAAPTGTDPPEGPLTVSLNRWTQNVYNDVSAAQSGDVEANLRVQARGRSMPYTSRNPIGWDESQDSPEPQAREGQASSGVQASSAVQAAAPAPTAQRAARRQRVRRGTRVEPPAPPAPPAPAWPLAQQLAEAVDYTSMAFLDTDAVLALHRVVSHEGTAVVQGVALDRRYIVAEWLPALVARHTPLGAPPSVIERADPRACDLRQPVATRGIDVDVCFPAGTLRAHADAADTDLGLQIGALVGLLVLVGFAAMLVDRGARRAEALSRQKSDFVAAVSHDLRTPLTTIRMYAEMMRDGLVPKEDLPRFHDDLVGESTRLSRLVENVLELSRIEQGKRPLQRVESDLASLARRVAEEQRGRLEALGFTLRTPGPDERVPISVDPQAFEQILVNLLDNAAKHGRGEALEIDVSAGVDAGRAFLAVADRGAGVPRAERQRVFDRFHRVTRPETAHVPGTGIGLSLVRDLARAHGGDATLEARPGGGAVVRVTFPRDPRAQ